MKRGIGKKAQTEKSIEELGFLIITAFVVIVSFFVISSLLASNSGGSRQEALNNAIALSKGVERLLKSNSTFDSYEMPVSIPNGYVLVGFDKDWHGDLKDDTILGYSENEIVNDKIEANLCSDGEGIQKPEKCNNVACLCIYSESKIGDDFMEEERSPEEFEFCQEFIGDISISALRDNEAGYFGRNNGLIDGAVKYPQPKPLFSGQDYEYLVAYGSCDGAFGIQKLHLEKYVDSGKTYITIIPVTPETKSLIAARNLTKQSNS